MHFGIKDLIDVLLVAFFLYQTYRLMRSSGTLAIFNGVISLAVVWILISQVLKMRLMGTILGKFISAGFVVLIISFQDEVRRFLLTLDSHRGWKFLGGLFSERGGDPKEERKFVVPVILTCMDIAWKRTGVLIMIQQDMDLAIYEHTGEIFNVNVDTRLIENIFLKSDLLHDGAMIIANNRIKAAGRILLVTQNTIPPKDMGLYHRSRLGMPLETDALVIIVSKEGGKISVAHKDRLSVNVTAEELQQTLSGEREVTNYC